MIKIFIKDNLFDETQILSEEHEWNGETLEEYLPHGEWIVNLNGENIEDLSAIPSENSQIVLTVKPEVEAIATYVFSAIAGSIATIGSATLFAVTAFSYMVAYAITFAGGLLINSLLGGQKPDSSTSGLTEASPTYSWEGATTLPRIGTAIPVLYGTHTLAGNIIQRRIEAIGDDQYLYLLLALCEGQIEDITSDDITIDNTSISNFTNAEWFFRNGTIDQDVIQYFGDTETPNNMSVKCSYNVPVVRQTISNYIEAFKIDLQFPSGLYYSNDRGGFDARSVMYSVEYREVGSATWIDIGEDIYDITYRESHWLSDEFLGSLSTFYPSLEIKTLVGHGFRQTAAKNTKINVSHRVDNLPFGQYEVRITRLTGDNLNVRQKDDMYIVNIGEIIYDDLRYPGIALFGMKIKANDQLSGGDPTLSIKCTRKPVEVFNELGVSQGLKSLSNPSWVIWDMLTNQDYGAGYNYNRAEYDSFLEWANWNDEMINDGFGGLENRNTFNGVFDVDGNVWDNMSKVATTGRAGMFIKGTKYIPIVDKPSLPVQMFNMGNIKKGTFTTSYMGTEDLATEVEIQFNNKDNAYAKDTLSVMVPEFYSQTEYSNKVTINQMGVTSQSQAYRIGRYFLACNKFMYRTCTFETGVDALGCSIGDVVYVAHDVPAWGVSGRTVGTGTINSVTLDESVSLIAGYEYSILLRQNETDVIDKRTFTASSTQTTNHITVSSNFSAIPTAYAVFTLFQTTLGTQLFRVTNISRAMDTMDRKLTVVDYNESVLSDTTTKIPTTASSMSLLPHVTTVSFKEHLEIKPTGALVAFIDFAWTCTGVFKDFDIMVSKDNGANYYVIAKDVIYTYHSFDATTLQENRQYLFKIVPRSLNNLSREALDLADVFAYTFMGKLTPPTPITNLSCTESGNTFSLEWVYEDKPLDFKEFVILYNGLEVGRTKTNNFNYFSLGLDTKTFTVIAQDTSGINSEYVTISHTATAPTIVNGLSVTFKLSGVILSWNASLEEDFDYFEIRDTDSGWGTVGSLYKGIKTECIIAPTYSRTYYLRQVDKGGNYSATSSILATLPIPTAPTNITNKFTDTTTSMAEVTLNWDDSVSPFGISYYKILYGDKTVTIKASEIKVTADWEGARVFSLYAYDNFGFSSNVAQITIVKELPNAPVNFRFQVVDNNILLYWEDPVITTLPITSYELRKGTSWDNAEMIGKKSGGFTTVFESAGGDYTYWIASIDSDNRYSLPTSVSATVSQPPDFILNVSNTSNFTGGTLCALSTTDKSANANVVGNTLAPIVIGNSWDTNIRATKGTLTGKWYWEVKIDTGGTTPNTMMVGVGTSSTTLTKYVGSDLTSWGYYGNTGTYYRNSVATALGEAYTTGDIIGVALDATLGLLSFFKNGIQQGSAISIGTGSTMYPMLSLYKDEIVTANFGELPFKYSPPSGFDGFSNVVVENGYLLANIDTAKTWATHFSSMGWTTIQAQITAGYPIYIQPTLVSGYYEETIDLGVALASSRITVTTTGQTLAGNVTTSCDISVSLDGISWTTFTNMFQVFATNFRYYKFKINISATTATGLYKITNITSVLDSKLKNDGGSKVCLSTDVGGTVVNFNVPFVDITSITVTPSGTTPITAMYDFVDTPYPTSFKILLFNSSGVRVSGTASWSVKGY